MSKFGVLVPVGPGAKECARLADLFDSLFFHEPKVSCALLVDDERHGRELSRTIVAPPTCEVASIPNPRQGRGHGWAGGLCVGVLAGLAWLQQHRADLEFVVKLDTDALVIAPFAAKVASKFRESPEVGLVGSYQFEPGGQHRQSPGWIPSIRSFLSPISLRGRYLQITLWGRPRRIREALVAALANSYQMSEHVQGGGYAVSAETLRRMASRGYVDDPLCWLWSGLTEDVMMGLYAHAIGMKLLDYNGVGEPFGVQYAGLPDRPNVLLTSGYSIIHSLKDHNGVLEEDTRRFFRSLRRNTLSALQ
jgi:hypothetical protein